MSSRRRPKTGDPGDILGSAAQTALLTAAADQRVGQMQAGPADQRADALRTADLVRRQRQKIGAQVIEIERDSPRRLDRIHMQKTTRLVDDLSDLADRLNNAGFVIGQHDGNQRRRPGQQRPQRVARPPRPANPPESRACASGAKAPASQDGRMLDRRNQQPVDARAGPASRTSPATAPWRWLRSRRR